MKSKHNFFLFDIFGPNQVFYFDYRVNRIRVVTQYTKFREDVIYRINFRLLDGSSLAFAVNKLGNNVYYVCEQQLERKLILIEKEQK